MTLPSIEIIRRAINEVNEVKARQKAHRGAARTIAHLKHLPVEGKRIMDIGANIGLVTEHFISRGAYQVLAYEPHPRAYASAIARNPDATIINAGLRTHAGTFTLSESHADAEHDYHCNATMIMPGDTQRGRRVYTTVRVERFDEAAHAFAPHGIKIDTEGSEYDILLNNTIPASVEWLCVEFHRIKGIGAPLFASVAQRLAMSGFGIPRIAPSYWRTMGQFTTYHDFTEVDFIRDAVTPAPIDAWISSIIARAQTERATSHITSLQEMFDHIFPSHHG